jgi:hypothetical protein
MCKINNTTFAGKVSREIRFYTIEEGAGQFCNPAQDFNKGFEFLVSTI